MSSEIRGGRQLAIRQGNAWPARLMLSVVAVTAVLCGWAWADGPDTTTQPAAGQATTDGAAPPTQPVEGKTAPTKPSKQTSDGQARGRQPRLLCEETTHDFGEVWAGTVCKHTFEITNVGIGLLQITDIKRSCGCTLTGKYDDVIPVGKTGRVPLSINTTRFRGKFSKSVTVHTNDPKRPRLILKLEGRAKPYIEIQPGAINFGTIKENEAKTVSITLTSNVDEPLVLRLPTDAKPGPVKAELKEEVRGKTYVLTATAVPPHKRNARAHEIILNTNLAALKEVKVPCYMSVVPRLALPRRVALPAEPGSSVTKKVVFRNNGTTPVHVLSAEIDAPGLEVTVKEQKKGEQYEIAITVPVGFTLPPKGAKLIVKTDDAEQPTLTVPVRAHTRPTVGAKREQRRPAMDLVGKAVPDFSMVTLSGTKVTDESLKGHVTVLDFYATWCEHSRGQLPYVEQVWKEYKDKGVSVFGVSQDRRDGVTVARRRTAAQVRGHYQQMGLSFAIALDPDRKVGGAFRVTSYPTLFVIGPSGVVEAVQVGAARKDMADILRSQLDALLAGKTHKDFARVFTPGPDSPAKEPSLPRLDNRPSPRSLRGMKPMQKVKDRRAGAAATTQPARPKEQQ